MDLLLDYLGDSSFITILVLLLLSSYFVLILWLFTYKFLKLTKITNSEKNALTALVGTPSKTPIFSKLDKCISGNKPTAELLEACEISLIRDQSTGLSLLAIVASTSPFIGLFGTVVGILESFAKFATESKVSFSVIAPAISEALVATAAGIFVAIFAYTFHQLMNRKLYELSTYLKAQSKILLSRNK
jgi:biopolymer transport protein ExbB/TolQ